MAALVSVQGVKDRLTALGASPNKALGQNFLVSGEALSAMVQWLGEENPLPILEIGPGLGGMTEALIAHAPKVVAVEKDAVLAEGLRGYFPAEKLTVLTGDFLKAALEEIHALLGGGPFLVAGNLPYYITTPICLKLLSAGLPIQRMLLMVQKEAMDRFFAAPGDRVYGPLRVMTALGYEASPLLTLSPASYYPQPTVSSGVVALEGKEELPPKQLLGFLEGVFAQRRKTILNNLLGMGLTKDRAMAVLETAGVAPGVRAESLPPDTLFALYRANV